MAFRFRKSIKIAPGIRLTAGKKSASVRIGGRGFGTTLSTSGRRTTTVGIPGTGLSYSSVSSSKKRTAGRRKSAQRSASPTKKAAQLPAAGFFASGVEKAFRKGLIALAGGDPAKCVAELAPHAPAGETLGSFQLLLGFAYARTDKNAEARTALERVVLGDAAYPDDLSRKYLGVVRVTGTVGIAAGVEAELEMDPAGAALLLAELYQEEGRIKEAADLIESVGGEGVEPNLVALSLAELYSGLEHEVLRVTDGAESKDDVTTAVLVYRASALREAGLLDAALDVHKASLRSRKRHKAVLNFAYYERSKTYEARGNARMARKDLETVYAVDPSFADVKSRLTEPGA